ncbi:uncharacterized protein LOC122505633 [Leptopilina heterotoma]|uniref:uncharacterized protein LOC122505633 n=1 Tax=Leptopilina heterotoma TaxID=63436 RepID=UPI001CA94E31|nr:uncharacterized protein LOC122505633 [Leptopilina heterotoma]
MKGMNLYFLCFMLKSVVGLPDFGNIPSIDELLLSGIDKDQDICSNVTSYACISREVNNYISADYYKNEAQSYIRRKAVGILNYYTTHPELVNFEHELKWYSTVCKGELQSTQNNSLNILKITMMRSKGVQYINDTEDSVPWKKVAKIYAEKFKFSPFFEVIFNDDSALSIRRPLTTMSFKMLHGGLTLLINKFFSEFAVGTFSKAMEKDIKARLNATVTTFPDNKMRVVCC